MTMLPLSDLSALYASAAASRLYDEAITELQHALQCAELATAAGESDALVAAALLHDVGHLLLDDQVGLDATLVDDYEHEKAGARYLAAWFGPEVTGRSRCMWLRSVTCVPSSRRTSRPCRRRRCGLFDI